MAPSKKPNMPPTKKPGAMSSKRASTTPEESDEDVDELSPEQILMRLKDFYTDEGLVNKSDEELKEMLEECYLNRRDRSYQNNMRTLSRRERPLASSRGVNFDDQADVSEFDTENPPNSEITSRYRVNISDSSPRAQSRIQQFLTQLKAHVLQYPQVIDSQDKKNEFISQALLVAAASYGIECVDERDSYNLERKIIKAITSQIEETPASPSESDFFESIERTTSFAHGKAQPAQHGDLEEFNSLEHVTSDSDSNPDSDHASEGAEEGEEQEQHAVNEETSPLLRGTSFAGVRDLLRARQTRASDPSPHGEEEASTSQKETLSPADSEPAAAAEGSNEEAVRRPPTRGNAFSRLRFGTSLPQKEDDADAERYRHDLPTSRRHVSRANSPEEKDEGASGEKPKPKP